MFKLKLGWKRNLEERDLVACISKAGREAGFSEDAVEDGSKDFAEAEREIVSGYIEECTKRLLKLYPNAVEVDENRIGGLKNVFAVRAYCGRSENFYIVYGYEIYKKCDLAGKNWVTTLDGKTWQKQEGYEGKMPKIDFWYCGVGGDLNRFLEKNVDICIKKYYFV